MFVKTAAGILASGFMALLLIGCSRAPQRQSATQPAATDEVTIDDTVTAHNAVTVHDALVQFSLLASLAAGDYVDGPPLREVLTQGDFGVGTFHHLNGEMIVLEGKIFQALADGSLRQANLEDSAPFAAVTFFNEDGRAEDLVADSLDTLDGQIDQILPRRNLPYALRIDGEFAELTLRSVPAQSPPYLPLVDVVKHQVTWNHRNLRGTLVGLHCPAWIGNLNVAGYHWHFLSEDRGTGGHVLACKLTQGLLRFDQCASLVVHLPESSAFDRFDSHQIDQQDIDEIERQRARPPHP